MITAADRAPLLEAVPSFAATWAAWCADHAAYVARFPEEALSEADLGHEFLSALAQHLGARVSVGEHHEVSSLFASLEPILAAADAETRDALTIGFLESLIYAVDRGDAARLGGLALGPAVGAAWRAAFEYIYPPAELPPALREG